MENQNNDAHFNNRKYLVLLFLILIFFIPKVFSMSLDWSGLYRFELVDLDRPTLADPKGKKSYFLNYLNLSPKIIAADGFNIVSSFDVLASSEYPDSQVGTRLGSGIVRTGQSQSTSSNVVAKNQKTTSIQVRQLYLNINQEYGAILIGRAPLNFGLGMSYNAGNKPFDHWGDVQDVLGYKFLIGNLSIMPMFGRIYDSDFGVDGDIYDHMIVFDYFSPSSNTTLGVFYRRRKASISVNDAPVSFYGNGGQVTGDWSAEYANILYGRSFDRFQFKVELGIETGTPGVTSSTGDDVKFTGFGFVTEMNWLTESPWQWSLKFGMASGDNPLSSNYEGFQFNRNYDIAFLMSNHPMGSYDIFRSGVQRSCKNGGGNPNNCTKDAIYGASNASVDSSIDEETVSNIIFVSPKLDYKMSDNWVWQNSITWAQLQTNSSEVIGNEVDKNLGFEWDTSLIYKPHQRLQWHNEVGILVPGAAWREGSVGRDTLMNYGFQSKLAISF